MGVNQVTHYSGSALLLAITVFGLSMSAGLQAQGQEIRPSEASCEVNSVFLRRGWKIPGLDGSRIQKVRSEYLAKSNAGPSDVGVTVLHPKKRLSTTLQFYTFTRGQLEVRDQLVIVGEIYRFDWHGRVFAYGVRYPFAAVERGNISELGKEAQVLYYDGGGKGVFEFMYPVAGFPFKPPIPDWVSKSPSVNPSGGRP